MPSVAEKTREWCAADLKYWEKAALHKITSGANLTKQDYEELLQYAMQDSGLCDMPASRPSFPLSPESFTCSKAGPYRILRLFNLKNVNALPEGQEISFDPQITLLYGTNAAGKTGYARLLACSAFARGQREVLPNVLETKHGAPQAEIEISRGAKTYSVLWQHGKHCPELSGIYVFDCSSPTAHLNYANALNFSPSSLAVLPKLAEVTDAVRQALQALIAQRQRPNNLIDLFSGDSDISATVRNLGAATNLDDLRKATLLSDEDRKRIASTEQRVAELRSQDPQKQIVRRRSEIRDLRNLLEAIAAAQTAFGDSAVASVRQLVDTLHQRRTELTRWSAGQFSSSSFTQVGTPDWHRFIQAARALATAEGVRGKPYPAEGDQCLLCRQQLTPAAAALLTELWHFLESDAQEQAQRAESACQQATRRLQNVNLTYFAADGTARRLLEEEAPTLVPMIESQREAWVARRDEMLASLHAGETKDVPPQIDVALLDVERLINTREKELELFLKSDVKDQLAKLEGSLRHLQHQQILHDNFPRIEEYVRNEQWIARARAALGNTRHITIKHNELFEELVTGLYVETFERTLKTFKPNMNVKIELRGRKGEQLRQIVLARSGTSSYSLQQVLSEGEKMAVALSDFLTEASLDEFGSGVVLDDPSENLDNDWKLTLARHLVELSNKRQVVVFTHDLAFLYQLNESAKEHKRTVTAHWVREEREQPGYVYRDNTPIAERDFRSAERARECYREATNSSPARQHQLLQQAFGALRTSYEALVIFELFNGVVQRFDERIRSDLLKDVQVPPDVSLEISAKMGDISRHIDAHLHSDALNCPPTPADLLKEIEAFEQIRAKIKAAKKLAQATMLPSRADNAPAKQQKTVQPEDKAEKPGTLVN